MTIRHTTQRSKDRAARRAGLTTARQQKIARKAKRRADKAKAARESSDAK